MLSKYIAIFLWATLAGVILAHSLDFSTPVVIGGTVFGLGALSAVIFFAQNYLKAVSAICLGLCFGILTWQGSLVPNQFSSSLGLTVNTTGVVEEWPALTSSGNQSVIIKPDGFSQDLRASLFKPIRAFPGDRVWIRGQIKQPENFSDFNYVSYLQKNNVYAELSKAKLIVITPNTGRFLNMLSSVRQWVIDRVNSRLSQSSANIVLGMLIGYSDGLPGTVTTAFQKTGLTHVLVVSGYNLTIIAGSIGVLAWVLGRRLSDVFSLGIVWVFVILTGSTGSVIRAGIMASIILLARAFGRLTSSYFTLLLAVVIMVCMNPLQLFFDIGFQLSVVATIGVLEANRLRIVLERDGWLTELLWPTLGAIIFTAPIISFYFGTFSLIAPVANLLVLPLVPVVMLFGAFALLPGIGILAAHVTELIVKLQLKIILLLSSWQYSSLPVKASFGLLMGYYGLLVLIREAYYHHQKITKIKDLKNTQSSDKMTKVII